MFLLRLSLILLVVSFSEQLLAADSAPALVSVVGNDLKSAMGELGKENDTHIEVLDLKTGEGKSFTKADLKSIRKDVSESSAIERFGLPVYMAWRIKKVVPVASASGKIAQLDGGVIYVSLGSNVGLEAGKELIVYRGVTEIKDPDTGEILGRQRRKVAKLEAISVEGKLTKAKLIGDLEIKLEVGDVVEPAVVSNSVAILPMVTSSGSETEGTKRIAEQLTTGLVNRGVSVVERRLLDKVLGELGLQQGSEFDPSKAQKVGKQLGAYGIVVGTVAPKGKLAEAQLRLVRVETGEILVAATQVLKDVGDVVAGSSPPKVAPMRKSPLIGRWIQSNGWAIELLETGEAINTTPKGDVDAAGKWQEDGKGKYSVRLGENNEWEWKMILQGNTLHTEAF